MKYRNTDYSLKINRIPIYLYNKFKRHLQVPFTFSETQNKGAYVNFVKFSTIISVKSVTQNSNLL